MISYADIEALRSLDDDGPWLDFAAAVAEAGAVVYRDDRVDTELLKAQGIRYLTRLMSAGILLSIEACDPEYPKFVRALSPEIQYALPAVDCKYVFAPVRGGHTYRVWGNRGSARVFDLEVWSGHPGQLESFVLAGKRTEFELGPGGALEVVLSDTEQPGNWVQTPERGGFLFWRQYFYDWAHEESGHLEIERVGATYPPPPTPADVLAERLQLITRWMRKLPFSLIEAVNGHYAVDPGTLAFAPLAYGWSDLQYGRGHYRCGPDDAVIVEMQAPDSHYWNLQLASHYWEALNWEYRHICINGHQAVIDDDGRFRAVISPRDPGVPNWLDCAGHEVGLITARLYRPASIPTPTIRTVPIEAVRSELPAGTPSVSPAERDTILRGRLSDIRRLGRG